MMIYIYILYIYSEKLRFSSSHLHLIKIIDKYANIFVDMFGKDH